MLRQENMSLKLPKNRKVRALLSEKTAAFHYQKLLNEKKNESCNCKKKKKKGKAAKL